MWLYWIIALLCVITHPTEAEPQRPNIVIILADDLGWNDVSFHGSRQIPTPNLDALAYDGIILKNYYVQQLCTPTRGALMTARYPIHTGLQHSVLVTSAPYGLGLNETIMPQYLKQLNYSTHIVGKWHLGFFAEQYTPLYRGFDSHFGYYQGCGDYYDHTYANLAVTSKQKQWGLDWRRDMKVINTDFGRYSTELFSNEAETIIQNHNKDKPLFMYLPHQAVHSGNGGTKEVLEAPWKYQQKVQHIKHPGRRMLAAMVSALDDAVGNVTKALHSRGMLNNTIIVFSTDNGGPAGGYDWNFANNWPLRGLKSTLWEGGTHASGFIWSPLLEKSGYHATQMLHVVDWLPTLLSAAGYEMNKLPGHLDGIDQWNVLSTNSDPLRTEFLYNIDPKEPSWAVRVHDMKLIFGHGSTGTYDGWYKPEQLSKQVDINQIARMKSSDPDYIKDEYNRRAVDNEVARHAWDTPEAMSILKSNSAPSGMFHSDLTKILLNIGRGAPKDSPFFLNCPYRPANYTTNCKPLVTPCLFNITEDPCEFNNLAAWMPEVVEELTQRMDGYIKTMVPPKNKKPDPKGFPYYHNGVWVPWIKLSQSELNV